MERVYGNSSLWFTHYKIAERLLPPYLISFEELWFLLKWHTLYVMRLLCFWGNMQGFLGKTYFWSFFFGPFGLGYIYKYVSRIVDFTNSFLSSLLRFHDPFSVSNLFQDTVSFLSFVANLHHQSYSPPNFHLRFPNCVIITSKSLGQLISFVRWHHIFSKKSHSSKSLSISSICSKYPFRTIRCQPFIMSS